jgi:hypothetical protein
MDQFELRPESENVKDDWIEKLIARLSTLLIRAGRKL